MRQLRVLVAVLAAAALTAPAAASARVVEARTILPPGQSGVVGDLHVSDQLQLFQDLQYKPEPLGGGPGGGAATRPRAGVTVRRDAFGVPAISAKTDADVWWGAGYAVAQDRLGEMELFRRRGSGRLAEVLGKSSLQDDVVARRDYYTDAELRRQFARLPARFRKRTLAYVAGVNAWIAHVRRTPAELPAEFKALKVPLTRWDLLDTLRIGVLLARTIPSGDGNELANLRALRALGPKRFAELLPLSVPGEITTIPANAGTFPSQPGRTRAQEAAAYARSQRWLKQLPLPGASSARAAGVPTGKERPAHAIDVALGGVHGSFMWAIRRPSDRHTFFFNGPQLGYQAPSTFVELDLETPAMQLHTGTAPGVPVNSNGYTGHMAWGVTSGLSDEDDLFAVRLAAASATAFRGHVRRCAAAPRALPLPPTTAATKSTRGAGCAAPCTGRCRSAPPTGRSRAATRSGAASSRRSPAWRASRRRATCARPTARSARSRGTRTSWPPTTPGTSATGTRACIRCATRAGTSACRMPGDGRAEWRGLLPRTHDPHVIDPPGRTGWSTGTTCRPRAGRRATRRRASASTARTTASRCCSATCRRPPPTRRRSSGRRSAWCADTRRIATQRPTAQAGAARRGRRRDRARPRTCSARCWRGTATSRARRPTGTVDPGVATWEAFKAAAQRVALGAAHARDRRPGRHTGRRGLRRVDARRDLRPAHARRRRAPPRGGRRGGGAHGALRLGRSGDVARRARDGQSRDPGPGHATGDPAAEPRDLRDGGRTGALTGLRWHAEGAAKRAARAHRGLGSPRRHAASLRAEVASGRSNPPCLERAR